MFGLVLKLAVAALAFAVIWRMGRAVLGGLVRPIPEPPPPGELRKVKITYRCALCGTGVGMRGANAVVRSPPRHCQDEMELVAPVDDI